MANYAAFLLSCGAIFGFAMLCATGANDVANALGTSVGSGALSFRRAIIVAAVFELLGASLVGGAVADTIQQNFIDLPAFGRDDRFAAGMCAAMAATLLWVSLATYVSVPVSTTHAIVGGVVGFAIAEGHASTLNGKNLGLTAASWVVSPLLGGVISALLVWVLRRFCLRHDDRLLRASKALPYLFGLNVATDVLFILVGGPPLLRPVGFKAWEKFVYIFLPALLGSFVLAAGVGRWVIRPYCFRAIRRLGDGAQTFLLSELQEELDEVRPLWTENDEEFLEEEEEAEERAMKRARKTQDEAARTTADGAPGQAAAGRTKGAWPEGAQSPQEGSTSSEPRGRSTSDEPGSAEGSDGERAEGSRPSPALPGFGPAEIFFAPLTIASACAVALAHGGNDVANAIGPFNAILNYSQNKLQDGSPTPFYINLLGGVGIVVGLVTFGYRVMATVGEKITKLSMSKAFAAQYGASVSILVATVLGLPISTTAVLVGCVIGVGLADGLGRNAVDLHLVKRIMAAWVITLPVSAIITAALYELIVNAWGR
jgi:phosphate/sulfate permease